MPKETNYATLPPRGMPTTFARQGAEIKRLQGELDAANKRLADANGSVNQWMEWYHNAEAELDAIRTAMRAYSDSDLVSLATTLVASDEAHEHLQEWAQAAYTRLSGSLDTVSAEEEIEIRQLLEDAPESVKGGEK